MKGASLLIVEDDPIVATDLQETLEQFGYRIVATERSGEKAVSTALSKLPDLVLMDITLEGKMDGVTAAEQIQANAKIPIIYLTAHSDEATLKRARISQPYAYVLKPFEEVELRMAIDLAIYRHAENIAKVNNKAYRTLDSAENDSPENERLYSILSNHQPFSLLPKAMLLKLLSRSMQLHIEAGREIDLESEKYSGYGLAVIEGRAAIVQGSMSGRDLIVELMLPGDTYGLAGDGLQSALRCRAQTKANLLAIPRRVFLEALNSHPELYRGIIEDLTRRLREAHHFARALAHDRVEVRVASALIRIGRRYSGLQSEQLTIPLTRQELADITGTTVETAIRVTRAMERAGVIDLSQTGVVKVLDIPEIESVIEQYQ